jgi:hypothetical protein
MDRVLMNFPLSVLFFHWIVCVLGFLHQRLLDGIIFMFRDEKCDWQRNNEIWVLFSMFLGWKWKGSSSELSLLHHKPKHGRRGYSRPSLARPLKIKQVQAGRPNIHWACGHCRPRQRSKQRRGSCCLSFTPNAAQSVLIVVYFVYGMFTWLWTSGTGKSISFKHPWSRFYTSGQFSDFLVYVFALRHLSSFWKL